MKWAWPYFFTKTVKHGGDEEQHADTRTKGKNVLSIDFPPPSELT